MRIYICIYMWVCVYVCMYVCVCVCVYIYIYIYIYKGQQIRNAWKVLKCGAGEGWRRSVGPIM